MGARRRRSAVPAASRGQLDHPHGLAADGATLLVADDDNDRIDRFDLNGDYLGSSGSLGAGGPLANPYGSRSARPATCTWPITTTTASLS